MNDRKFVSIVLLCEVCRRISAVFNIYDLLVFMSSVILYMYNIKINFLDDFD